MIQSFRFDSFNTSTSKTEFIKAEFETNCNDVIDIHPYVDQNMQVTDEGDEEIESLPQPQPYSSSSSSFTNTQPMTFSTVQHKM